MLAEYQSLEGARERLESLRTRLADFNNNPIVSYDSSISYGIIQVGSDNQLSVSELLSIVDEKMYEYKRTYKIRHKSKLAQIHNS